MIGLLVAALVSCTSEIENCISGDEVNTVNVSVEEFHGLTRTTVSNTDYSVHWNTGDIIGIFPLQNSSRQIAFDILSASDASSASFDGKGWGMRYGIKYVAYYPLTDKATLDKTGILLDYKGQSQTGNNNTAHLGAYDYMFTVASTPVNGSLNLQFRHAGTLLHFQIPVAESKKYTKVEISTDGNFYTQALMNLENSTITPVGESKTKKIEMTLTNVLPSGEEALLDVYLMAVPVDLTGCMITANAYDEDGTAYSISWEGKNLGAGKYVDQKYIAPAIPYVTFSAEAEQTLTMSRAVETLEYSVNDGAWQTLDTSPVTFGGSNGNLRLRGMSNIGTASGPSNCSTISFGNETNVTCTGDIRTLVDYKNYDSADTSQARFCSLFKNCLALTSAPDLPATTLATYCYSDMFYHCSSLTIVPELPAKTLKQSCYFNMFRGCTSLISAPELPATTLANYCYVTMFCGCSNLVNAPVLPATLLADGCYQGMFWLCTSLTQAPDLPAKTLKEACYQEMFLECTNLTSAPELPATTLARQCYYWMFSGCKNLTSAPVLPATKLMESCYDHMFQFCNKLNYIKMLATDISAYGCLGYFTTSVSTTGTFVKNAAATWTNDATDEWGKRIIPSGWTVQTAAN